MNDLKLPPTALLEERLAATSLPTSKGELVVVPAQLADLASAIRQSHREVEAATVHAVVKALETGKALLQAKRDVGHGNFDDFVAVECRFAMRTAQNYMRLAKQEAKVCQMLAEKRTGSAYLTLNQALKFITALSKQSRRKKRP
jgi:hypothetical protein